MSEPEKRKRYEPPVAKSLGDLHAHGQTQECNIGSAAGVACSTGSNDIGCNPGTQLYALNCSTGYAATFLCSTGSQEISGDCTIGTEATLSCEQGIAF